MGCGVMSEQGGEPPPPVTKSQDAWDRSRLSVALLIVLAVVCMGIVLWLTRAGAALAKFKPHRTDVRYCSAARKQHAYRHR